MPLLNNPQVELYPHGIINNTIMDIAPQNDHDPLQTLALDCLNLFDHANSSSSFSDVVFVVEGKHVHAHRCILAARSTFFRMVFSSEPDTSNLMSPCPRHNKLASVSSSNRRISSIANNLPLYIPVGVVGYKVFVIMLRFLYSGQLILKECPSSPSGGEDSRGTKHRNSTDSVDLALEALHAANFFGVEQLSIVIQDHLGSMVGKLPIHDVMRILVVASKKQLGHEYNRRLWEACSKMVARSGLGEATLRRHLPLEIAMAIEEIRTRTQTCRNHVIATGRGHEKKKKKTKRRCVRRTSVDMSPSGSVGSVDNDDDDDEVHDMKGEMMVRRMRQALEGMDVELVRLMVMGEGLNLDRANALHYAVERHLGRDVVKALLEMGALDVDHPGRDGRTALHIACEMGDPDIVSLLLDHHASPLVGLRHLNPSYITHGFFSSASCPSSSSSSSSSSSPPSPSSSPPSSSSSSSSRGMRAREGDRYACPSSSPLEIVRSKLASANRTTATYTNDCGDSHDDNNDNGKIKKLRLCLELLQSAACVENRVDHTLDFSVGAKSRVNQEEEEEEEDDADEEEEEDVNGPSEPFHEESWPKLPSSSGPMVDNLPYCVPTHDTTTHTSPSSIPSKYLVHTRLDSHTTNCATQILSPAQLILVPTHIDQVPCPCPTTLTSFGLYTHPSNNPTNDISALVSPHTLGLRDDENNPEYLSNLLHPITSTLLNTTIVTNPNGLLYPHFHTNSCPQGVNTYYHPKS